MPQRPLPTHCDGEKHTYTNAPTQTHLHRVSLPLHHFLSPLRLPPQLLHEQAEQDVVPKSLHVSPFIDMNRCWLLQASNPCLHFVSPNAQGEGGGEGAGSVVVAGRLKLSVTCLPNCKFLTHTHPLNDVRRRVGWPSRDVHKTSCVEDISRRLVNGCLGMLEVGACRATHVIPHTYVIPHTHTPAHPPAHTYTHTYTHTDTHSLTLTHTLSDTHTQRYMKISGRRHGGCAIQISCFVSLC